MRKFENEVSLIEGYSRKAAEETFKNLMHKAAELVLTNA